MTNTYLFLGGPDHGKELAVFPADAQEIINYDPITGAKEHKYLRRTYVSASGDGASRQVFVHSSIVDDQWNAISEYLFEEWVHSYSKRDRDVDLNHNAHAFTAEPKMKVPERLQSMEMRPTEEGYRIIEEARVFEMSLGEGGTVKIISDEHLNRLLDYLKLHSPWVRSAVDRERMIAKENAKTFAEEFARANPRMDVVGVPDPGNPFGVRSVAFTTDPRINDYVQLADERIGDPRSHIMMRDRDAFGMELYTGRCGVRREPYRWHTSNERVENPYQVPWCPGCLAAVGVDFKVKPYPPKETDG